MELYLWRHGHQSNPWLSLSGFICPAIRGHAPTVLDSPLLAKIFIPLLPVLLLLFGLKLALQAREFDT